MRGRPRRHQQAIDRFAAFQARDDRIRARIDEADRCQRRLSIMARPSPSCAHDDDRLCRSASERYNFRLIQVAAVAPYRGQVHQRLGKIQP